MKIQRRRSKGLLVLFLFSTAALISQGQKQHDRDDLISLVKQKSGLQIHLKDEGWSWKEEDIKGTPERGEITFSDTKWLMYLIHWGPIQVPKISVDYVKQRMLKMWGVKFEFTGQEGWTKVAGHDAVWVEAYGTNRIFYSRYLIWNCPESGREFIADTNYNIQLKTPEEDFEKEIRSAKTIRCHEGGLAESSPGLTQRYGSEKFGFSFYFPEKWFFFDSPYYVPFPQYQGLRNREIGSLLCLCSDQNLSVTLKWSPLDETLKEESFMGVQQKLLEILRSEIQSHRDVASIRIHGMEEFLVGRRKISRIWGGCTFREPENESAKAFFTGKGIFQVAQWGETGEKKKITVILVTRQYRYRHGISSPARHIHDRFLRDFVSRITD